MNEIVTTNVDVWREENEDIKIVVEQQKEEKEVEK